MPDLPATLFQQDGPGRYVPTEWCRGPWDPNALHAGSSGALLTQLVDAHPALVPMRVVRLSFDIVKPVPLAPLDVALDVEREGKRIQVVSAVLSAEGVEVTRMRALRIRRGDVTLPEDAPTSPTLDDVGLTAPEEAPESAPPDLGTGLTFFAHAMEMRSSHQGLLWPPGPGSSWFRLRHPVIDEQPATQAARVVAAADFGNGLSAPVSYLDWIYINADLQVMIQREPVDDWVGVASLSVAAADGTALTTSRLADRTGQIGTATQSLYVEPRAAPITPAGDG